MLDAHEAGIVMVASRTPFRESGPPACMAKLIMLRHKSRSIRTKRKDDVAPAEPVRQCSHTLFQVLDRLAIFPGFEWRGHAANRIID